MCITFNVCWKLTIPEGHINKLVQTAVETGCGDRNDVGRRELIQRLMLDGGESIIQEVLQDPANIEIERIVKMPNPSLL